ncbi:MAG: helix-turn-helix domain-containing protein [Sphingomonas fennica]
MHASGDRHESFNGNARLASLGRLKLGRIMVSAHEARWTHELMRTADAGFVRLVIQCGGTAEIEQGDARFLLRPGEWTALHASRPHTIRSQGDMDEIIVIVPRAALPPSLFDASLQLSGAHSAGSALGRLATSFARSMLDFDDAAGSQVDEHLDHAGLEIIAALLRDRLKGRPASSCRDLRAEQVEAYVRRHYAEPDLTVATIAAALSCSRRYVHALFEGRGSVHRLIWQTRLDQAAKDLRQLDRKDASITVIALANGFSCPAHFSRLFRATFDTTPRDYRRLALNS